MVAAQPKEKKRTRRDEIYDFVVLYAIDHLGNTPSLGEIGRHFGIRRCTVYTHTLKLVNDRRAEWRDGELILLGSEFSPPSNT